MTSLFKRLLLLASFSLLSISILFSQSELNIKVIQTSDVHGAIFPFDFINNRSVDFGLAQVYSYVMTEREKPNQEVLLFDSGDILQGQPTVYYANFIDSSDIHLAAQVMNFMGYDAASVGNHDIEAGPAIYNKLVDQFTFPWLSANIINTETGKTYFKPYTVFNIKGVKLAVLGLTTPGIPKWLPKRLWYNMVFNDMVEEARLWMDSIRINEKPDLVIGLFHSGHNAGYEGADPNLPLNENASLLVAKNIPGFDAVMIGHDHDRTIKNIVNLEGDTVLVLDPGSSAHLVSELSIKVKFDSKGKIIGKKLYAELIAMRDYIPHPEYVSNFSEFSLKVAEFVDRKIGYIQSEVSSRDSYFGPSAFINLIHSVQLGISNAEISFAAPLSFDSKIEQGIIHVRDMFKLYSFENLLYLMNLTGSEVKNYLEYSYGLWLNTMTSDDDNLILFRKDENGLIELNRNGRGLLRSSFFNFDAAAGIIYTVDVSKPVGSRINIKQMENGQPFDETKTYRVAINSYRGTGGGGHLIYGAGLSPRELNSRIINVSQMDIRHYLIKWIEHVGKVGPQIPSNWEIIPIEWVSKASKVDREILFGNESD